MEDMSVTFHIEIEGELTIFLGIEVVKSRDCINLNQERYSQQVLERCYTIEECKYTSTPTLPISKTF